MRAATRMFRRFAVSILLIAGSAGWSAANAQDVPVSGSDWCDFNGTSCAAGGTLSASAFMIAHRTERHSMVTSDGAIHVIVNTGSDVSLATSSPATDGLQLYTSTNGGISWTFQPLYYTSGGSTVDIFEYTTGGTTTTYTTVASTTDVAVVPPGGSGGQNTMTLIFTDMSNTAVEEAQLSWTGSAWTVTAFSQAVPPSTGYTYTMPSYVAENQGSGTLAGEYLAVVATGPAPSTATQILTFYNQDTVASPNYYATPFPQGVTIPGGQPLHAPRLVWLPTIEGFQDVGLLYQAVDGSGNEQLYWEVLIAGPAKKSWTLSAQQTVGGMPTSRQNFVYNSGFSVATVVTAYTNGTLTDPPGTQYVAYLGNGSAGPVIQTALFTPSTGGTPGTWTPIQTLPTTSTYVPSYVKVTYTAPYTSTESEQVPPYGYVYFDRDLYINPSTGNGTLYIDNQTAVTPLTSNSCIVPPPGTSTCFSHNLYLATPSAQCASSTYANPRLEAPEYAFPTESADIPVWLQYQPSLPPPDPNPYSLFFWEVAAPTGS